MDFKGFNFFNRKIEVIKSKTIDGVSLIIEDTTEYKGNNEINSKQKRLNDILKCAAVNIEDMFEENGIKKNHSFLFSSYTDNEDLYTCSITNCSYSYLLECFDELVFRLIDANKEYNCIAAQHNQPLRTNDDLFKNMLDIIQAHK